MNDKPSLSARERWRNLFEALSEDEDRNDASLSDLEAEKIKFSMLSRLVADPKSQLTLEDVPEVFKEPPASAKDATPTGGITPETESRSEDEPPLNPRRFS